MTSSRVFLLLREKMDRKLLKATDLADLAIFMSHVYVSMDSESQTTLG